MPSCPSDDSPRGNNPQFLPGWKVPLAIGFSDGLYFSKVFKKYVKISPTEYKKIYS